MSKEPLSVLRNYRRLRIVNTEAFNVLRSYPYFRFKNHLYSKENELKPDASKESTILTTNFKRKRKQTKPFSPKINFHKQTIQRGAKRRRAQ
jgi:hypothetical protein